MLLSSQAFVSSSVLRLRSNAIPPVVAGQLTQLGHRPLLTSCSKRRSRIVPSSHAQFSDVQGPSTPDDARQHISLSRIAASIWGFSRPHTVYGTVLSVMSLTMVAALYYGLPIQALSLPFLTALLPALLLNIYIVGLNQLHDMPIDRVNKPYLPLASGAMTVRDARAVIVTALVSGLAFCFAPAATPALRIVLTSSAALGTAYSMPPLRLKRFALLASIAILTVRGLLVNIGFFLHAAATRPVRLFRLPLLPPPITFATIFFTVFGVVIALLKDVPDIKGDRMFGIRTFSVNVGAPAIFRVCVATLITIFLAAGAFYFSIGRNIFGRITSLTLHVVMALFLGWRARRVDPSVATNVTDFYMLSWKAFYAEYMFLPFVAL